jgi:hypothetical protein
MCLMATGIPAQQKTSALTGVNWVPVTGSGAPTAMSCGVTCTSAFYGLPYTDVTNQNYYVYTGTGSVSGWTKVNSAATGTITNVQGTAPIASNVDAGVATVSLDPSGVTAGCPNIGGQIVCITTYGTISSIGSPFSMGISCTAAGTYEAGNATTNPNTCTFSYSNGTPASASLSDGTHNVTLTSPYTSGALAYQYCTPSEGVTSFTFSGNATATNSQTASASTGTNCTYREFGGVGTAGATGATASGTNAVLVGATGTLASAGFGQQNTWGPYSPSNQYIYVLGTSNSCTFTFGGFAFLMNSPISVSFTNQYDAVIGMWLYGSVNPQNGSVTLSGSC